MLPRPLAGASLPPSLRGALFRSTRPGLPPAPEPFDRAAGLSGTLGRIGSLEVRLALTRKEVKKAQRLRYRVFYEEMSAIPDVMSRLKRRDIDPYDCLCDHLLVIDHAPPAGPLTRLADVAGKARRRKPRIVGTYRLLRQDAAERAGGFYTAGEFDIAPMLAAHPGKRFLELGRSCVLRPYRDKRTVELLWHGIWTYVLHHRIDVMFGCASLEGADPRQHAAALSFLHRQARAPEEWRVAALPGRHVPMDTLEGIPLDQKKALHALPPLIKGYLRLGARVGESAVVDRQFGTTDVLIVLPVGAISPRYIGHFGAEANRHAA